MRDATATAEVEAAGAAVTTDGVGVDRGRGVEVVPVGEHRRLRERIRLATALGGGAALLAVAGLVVFLATRGGGKPTPAEIVADAKHRTVLITAKIPGGTSGGTGFVLDATRASWSRTSTS